MAKKKKVVATVPLPVIERRLTDALVEAYTHRMGVRGFVCLVVGHRAGERIVGRAHDTIVKRIAEDGDTGTLADVMFNRAKSSHHVLCRVE